MYLEHFGFREEPFRMTPDPMFFFPSKQHRAAIAGLVYLVEFRKGFGILTGGIGTGKTMLTRILLSRLGTDTRTALIVHPPRKRGDLLQAIMDELQITGESNGNYDRIGRIQQYLLEQLQEGQNVVLIIDEAQHLDVNMLEEVRMLSNMETDKEKILQIILVGQEELRATLSTHELRQLSQRIVVNCTLEPFTFNDTCEYIQHRIDVAGLPGVELFDLEALQVIHDFTHGVPRVINSACDRCLLAEYAKRSGRVTVQTAQAVLAEFAQLRVEPKPATPIRKSLIQTSRA
ncbi:TPA: ATPase [Candidatus Sumerlaeota bacterium]|jgi:general secretion pathway protein A|nr:ATPase [Candidatus Sumerlaeota bacterium]